jgi:flagellar biosynthesis/type III secretory pathway protein FliH
MSSERAGQRDGGTLAYAFEPLEAPTPVSGVEDPVAAAWAQADEIREQARLEGEAEGRAAGLAEARAEGRQAVDAFAVALAALRVARAELLAALEQDALELAFQLTERILAGAVSAQPERVLDVTRNALRRLTDRHRVTLSVHPADLELVSDSVQSLRAELGGIEHCEIQADRRIGRGGAVVSTAAGEIDATIEAGLDRAREIVAAALGRVDTALGEDDGH